MILINYIKKTENNSVFYVILNKDGGLFMTLELWVTVGWLGATEEEKKL